MSTVIDIVTQLNFESNSDVLGIINKEFGTQIKQISDAQSKIVAYEAQRAKLSSTEKASYQAITALIQREKQAIDQLNISIGKQLQGNVQLQKQVQGSKQQFDSLAFSLGNLLRDAPYGFIGIANNIGPAFDDLNRRIKTLQSEGKSTVQVLGSIGASLFTVTTFVNLAVIAFQLFGDQLFDFSTDAERAEKITAKLAKETDILRKEVESFKIPSFYDTQNLNALDNGAKALQRDIELRKARGEQGKSLLADENRLNSIRIGNLKDEIKLYESRTTSIIRFDKEIYDRKQEIADLENKININNANFSREQLKLQEKENENLKKYLQLLEDIRLAAIRLNRPDLEELEDFSKRLEDIAKEIGISLGKLEASFTERIDLIVPERSGERGNDTQSQLLNQADNKLPLTDKQRRESQLRSDRILAKSRLDRERATLEEIKKLGNEYDIQQQQERVDQAKKLYNEASQYIVDRNIEIVQTVSNTVGTLANLYNTLADAQIAALDREYEYRAKRVEDAKVLAERGNIAVLEEEQKRLDETAKKREEFAKRQQAINTALAISEAVVAIATTASQSGVGSIVTIPAVIAAIAGGYAAIRAATTDAFAEGVVDYKGKGTGTSDSNLVRISHGESIITAEATKQYAPFLEQMNAGTFKAVTLTPNNGFASRGELRGVEEKLDAVIEVLGKDRMTVNTNFNESGVSQYIERAKYRNQNKYRR